MDELIRLTAATPKQFVHTIQGSKGFAADYVSWHVLAQLLIGRLRKPYHWIVEEVGRADNEWYVVGTLTVTVDGEYFRVGAVRTGKDPESAESRAFARAAAKLGLGLDLYCKEGEWFLHGGLVGLTGNAAEVDVQKLEDVVVQSET